jgi:hypothetical protein
MDKARTALLAVLVSCTSGADVSLTPGETAQAISPFSGFWGIAGPDDWHNMTVAQRTSGVTTFSFTVTAYDTDGLPIDVVIGFSSLPAANFTDLGPILRFNPDGMIDVRNGDRYTADVEMPYRTNPVGDVEVRYPVRMVIDMDAHRYSVFVREDGGPEVALASNYQFRSENADMARIGNVAAFRDSSHGILHFTDGSVSPQPCKSSSATSGWATATSYPETTNSYFVEVDTVPAASNIDALIGLASSSPSTYGDLAAILRFNSDGFVDARDGDVYRASQRISYTANHLYTAVFLVNLERGTYSAWLDDPAGNAGTLVASDYRFRTEQAGTRSLGTVGQKADAGVFRTCDVGYTPF